MKKVKEKALPMHLHFPSHLRLNLDIFLFSDRNKATHATKPVIKLTIP